MALTPNPVFCTRGGEAGSAASQSWKWGEVDTRVHVLTHSEVEALLEQVKAEEGAEAA